MPGLLEVKSRRNFLNNVSWMYFLACSRQTKSSNTVDKLVIYFYELLDKASLHDLRTSQISMSVYFSWTRGPGHIYIHSATRMMPYAAESTSECDLSNQITMCPQCVLAICIPVLRADHLWLDQLVKWIPLVIASLHSCKLLLKGILRNVAHH